MDLLGAALGVKDMGLSGQGWAKGRDLGSWCEGDALEEGTG